MSHGISQACPLCGGAAAFERFRNPETKHFECPSCVEFCIDDDSERRLNTMEEEFRTRHAAHARGSNSSRLWVIRAPNANELARDRSLTMMGEFVQRGG